MNQATAAQMARRTIKNAKTPRRQPIVSNSTTPQQQSMTFGGGGSLFGNGLPQSNTFNFAAPAAPSISFPPPQNSFGNLSSPEHSESEEAARNSNGHRPDLTGEESKRRNKDFRPDPIPQKAAQTSFGNSTTSNIFGNTQSAPNPFTFNAPQAAPSSIFNLTPSNAQPAPNPFTFNAPQQPTPATTPSITAGLESSQNKTADMSQSQQSGQPQSSTPSMLFGGGSVPSQPFQFTSSMASTQPTAPTPSLFGNSAPAAGVFSQPQQTQPSNNLFNGGGLQNGGLFNSSTAQTQSPAKSLFDTSSQPKSDLFGKPSGDLGSRMTFPSAQSSDPPSSNAPSIGRGIWDSAPKSDANPFGMPSTQPGAFTPTTAPSASGDLFGRVSKAPESTEPVAPAKPLFGVQPTSTSTSLFGAKPTAPVSPVKENTALFNGSSLFQPKPPTPAPSQIQATSQSNFASDPPGTPSSLFSNLNKPVEPNMNFGHAAESVQKLQGFSSPSKPASSGLTNGSVAKVTSHSFSNSEMAAVGEITDDAMYDLVPPEFTAKQRNQFYKAYRLRSLNKAMQNFFASIPSHVDPAEAIAYFTEMRQLILGRAAVSGSKRKVNVGENQENEMENPSKRSKADTTFVPQKAHNSTSPVKALAEPSKAQPSVNGSGLFQAPTSAAPSQFFSPSVPPSQSQPFGNGNTTSSSNLFNIPQSSSQTPLPAKSKRKADDELTKDIFEAQKREISKASSTASEIGSGRSNTSALFQSIAESPSKPGMEKKIKSLPSAINSNDDEGKRTNPFASIPKSPTKPQVSAPAAKSVSSLPANDLFAPKPTPLTSTPGLFTPKPAPSTPSLFASQNAAAPSTAPAVSSNNLFGSKPAAAANPFQPSFSSGIKAPSFGAPVNFLAQFNQKAAQDKEAHEKKLMEEAEAADYDSDEEDLQSWRAKYKLKRKAELEEIENIAKASKPKYDPSKGFTFNSTANAASKPTTIGITNAVDRASVSGTSSPARSIFETGTPPVLDVDNPFSKFAQPTHHDDSDSEEAEESEDDSKDNGEEEIDADSENKDPNYQPGQEVSGPGTPVEETGVGIVASAKKGGIFSFGAGKVEETDSSATPSKSGRSLFDRVSYPAGRATGTSSEEKENTKPAETKGIFGNPTPSFGSSFGSASGTPANQTWDQTKGINFASSATPSVNVTTATPTKPVSGSLFGTSKPSTPSTGLFGAATAGSSLFNFGTSPSAGFQFGAPTSGTSSLLPSTAVSNNTSRATTPGATSDDGETDPDGVKHTQADFTRGAGEEDEDILFESKARASKLKGKEWTKCVGIVRVLKHRETGATRILHRKDPSGAVVMNYSIPNTKYTSTKSSLAMVLVEADGKFSTWSITVKTPQEAEELVAILNEHKNV